MSTPANIEELLTGYLDGNLTESERRYLDEELAKSPALVAQLALLRRNSEALRQLPQRTLPRDFSNRVIAAAQEQALASGLARDHYVLRGMPRPAEPVVLRPTGWSIATVVYGLASLAAVLLLGYAVSRWTGMQDSPGQGMASLPPAGAPVDKPILETPTEEPKSELVRKIIASQWFLMVVDVYPTSEAWNSKLIGRMLDDFSIKMARPIVAADIAESLNAARTQMASTKKGAANVIFVNANFGSVAKFVETLYSRVQDFPTVTLDLAIDRPAINLLQRLTQKAEDVASFSKPFASTVISQPDSGDAFKALGFVARREPSSAQSNMVVADLQGLKTDDSAFIQVLVVVHLPN
jgi:hypothetical protein